MNVYDSFFIYLRWWDYKINVSLVEYINGSPVFYHLCVKIKTKHWNLVKNIINYQTHKRHNVHQTNHSLRLQNTQTRVTGRSSVSNTSCEERAFFRTTRTQSGHNCLCLYLATYDVAVLVPFNLDHRWHVDCIVAFVCVRACCVCDSSLWFVVLVPWKCILNCIATLLHPQTGRSQITTQLLSGSGLAVRV